MSCAIHAAKSLRAAARTTNRTTSHDPSTVVAYGMGVEVNATTEIPQSAFLWIAGHDTGSSSHALWAHMAGGLNHRHPDYPLDPSDIGRCFRLLERVPEWKPRIGEMAEYGGKWKYLAEHWQEIYDCMAAEVGIDWSKGRSAPKTYALMNPEESR